MKPIFIIALAMLALPLGAQPGGKVETFSAKDIKSQLAALAPKANAPAGSSAMLGDYKTHSIRLVARTTSGGAEVHNHFDDIIIVTEGTATIVTGGSVVDPHEQADGEIRGASVKDGQTQAVAVGDAIHIPAGTPHQTLVTGGTVFSAMVIKVREP